MGVVHQQNVTCRCGRSFPAELAESVNATRFPQFRDQILAGTFHRVHCPYCSATFTVEKSFNYIDLGRDTVFTVKPRHDRHLWEDASEELDGKLAKIPAELLSEHPHVRVVFGMGELREKLVAQDAGLDDRDVEMLKALVAYEHPFLLQTQRLRLHLTSVTSDSVEFMAGYDHADRRYRVTVPRGVADPLMGEGGTLQQWSLAAHGARGIYSDTAGHWVNMWRWSPRTWALAMLGRYDATIRAGGTINLRAKGFSKMLDYLPRGNQLPTWAKRALRNLFLYVKGHSTNGLLQDRLFEIRFDIGLDDDWALNNDPDDIATLWDLMKDLPDTNVEGNTKINDLNLDTSGSSGGWYEPWSGDIYIGDGALSNVEWFQDVVRHEVGHAVHEANTGVVDPWLASRWGWRMFDASNSGVDAWVAEMGGWGSLTATERGEVRQWLLTGLGGGSSWTPGPGPNPPANHPWRRADFGPRLAFERTGANWFNNNANWYQRGGKAFFMNFWYRLFMVVDAATLDLVNTGMPSRYASMSPFEFFAELYALHYDLDDPQRPNIPADAATWLNTNIGAAVANQPSAPGTGKPRGKGAAAGKRPAGARRPAAARPRAERTTAARPRGGRAAARSSS